MRDIGICIGNLGRWGEKTSNIKKILSNIEIDGVELVFKNNKELNNFKLSKKDAFFFFIYKFISIHAPWKEYQISDTSLKKLDKIAKSLNLLTVVVHPTQIKQNKWKTLCFPVSTENLKKDRKHETILEKNSDVGLVLDVAHAYAFSPNETKKIIKKFKERIVEVHLSSRVKGEDHEAFKLFTKGHLRSIESIKKLSCPLVLETSTAFSENKKKIKKEIKEVRKWLGEGDGKKKR